jgi:CubicO group peptidase (beta-lactamase class C family)
MADRTSAASELEATLGWFVKDRRLAGAAAGVVCGDGATWSGGAGYADLASGTLATPATLYRVASITKTFTGMAVMQLRDAGLLDLDEPAITYLPEMRDSAQPDARLELVTLRRMLAHASGLASEPPGTDWTVPLYQGVVTRTLGHPGAIATRVPVGQHPKYSNLAYQLLGEVVARAAGIPYVEYMQEKVLLPLEMDATSFDPAIGLPQQLPATGYAPRAFSDELEVASVMPPLWAEGGLWSCVDDLIKWVSVQLEAHRGNAPDPAILSGISLREMHAPRYLDGNDWTQAWGSPGARCAGMTRSGSSIQVRFPGSQPRSASTLRARWAASS